MGTEGGVLPVDRLVLQALHISTCIRSLVIHGTLKMRSPIAKHYRQGNTCKKTNKLPFLSFLFGILHLND